MRRAPPRWRQAAAGLALGAVAMAVALWGVDLGELRAAFAAARAEWLVPVGIMFLIQQAIRAWRQAVLVRAMRPDHRFRTSLSVLCIGFFLINTLPARLGELARPVLLRDREDLPLAAGLGVVVVERAVDLGAMFAMIGLVAWRVPVPSQVLVVGGHAIDWVDLGRRATAAGVPAILAAWAALVLGGPRVVAALRAGRPGAARRRLADLAEGFVAGLAVLRRPRRLAAVLALTVATWTLTAWMYPVLARAFGLGDAIGLGEGTGILAITMLGMTVPSAPGFAGTYEAFVRGALALFGVHGGRLDAVAVAYALTMHWWIFLVQSATALYFLAVDRVGLGALIRRTTRGAPGPDPEGGG